MPRRGRSAAHSASARDTPVAAAERVPVEADETSTFVERVGSHARTRNRRPTAATIDGPHRRVSMAVRPTPASSVTSHAKTANAWTSVWISSAADVVPDRQDHVPDDRGGDERQHEPDVRSGAGRVAAKGEDQAEQGRRVDDEISRQESKDPADTAPMPPLPNVERQLETLPLQLGQRQDERRAEERRQRGRRSRGQASDRAVAAARCAARSSTAKAIRDRRSDPQVARRRGIEKPRADDGEREPAPRPALDVAMPGEQRERQPAESTEARGDADHRQRFRQRERRRRVR